MFFRDVILKEFFVFLKIINFYFYNLFYDMKLCKFFEIIVINLLFVVQIFIFKSVLCYFDSEVIQECGDKLMNCYFNIGSCFVVENFQWMMFCLFFKGVILKNFNVNFEIYFCFILCKEKQYKR